MTSSSVSPPPSRGLNTHEFPAYARVIAHTLAYALIKPLLFIIDKVGLSDRLWKVIGRKMRQDIVEGHDFGDYQPTASDVIVCTYPKCGTNWTMQITHQIATRGAGEFKHIHDVVPWPDFLKQDLMVPLSDDSVLQASPTGLRVIKTHLEWERVPYATAARYICIVRDPKDAFVSSYHFVREVFFGPVMPSVERWLKLFCSDGFPFMWPVHVHGYWAARELPNLLILTFEETRADMPAAIKRIAEFMGVELSADEFEKVCEKSAFGYMKSIGECFNPPALTPLSPAQRTMIRRGVSGGSGEMLDATQQQTIDDWCKSVLAELNSDVPFDTLWGTSGTQQS
jgi:hypothetical protein